MNILSKTIDYIATCFRSGSLNEQRAGHRLLSEQSSDVKSAEQTRIPANFSESMQKLITQTLVSPLHRSSMIIKACVFATIFLSSVTANAFDELPPPIPNNIFDVNQNSQGGTFTIGGPEPDLFAINNGGGSSQMFRERGNGYFFKTGHQAGKAFGSEQSLTYLETMGYTFWEQTMFLADGRIWILNDGRLGGSVGSGVRKYFPVFDRTLGMIVWYDMDGTYRDLFTDVAITLESHGNIVDWDANIFIPLNVREQQVGLDFVDGSQEFVGNNIQFDQIRTTAFALQGFDSTWTTPIGTEFAQQYDMRMGAGIYYYQHDQIDDFWGWKTTLDANLMRYLDLNLAVTGDKVNDTLVTLNASWTFDPEEEMRERDRPWDRMVLPPKKMWTVPKAEIPILEPDQVAINPATGLPYFVVHVDSITGSNVAGAGPVTMPFDTIDNAMFGGNAVPIDTYDTVFVWSGGTYDNQPTIIVPEGKRILGGGDRVVHQFDYGVFGMQDGPRARNDYDDGIFDPRPLFTNLGSPAGPGVRFEDLTVLGGTVYSNASSEFSGFVLGNPDGTNPLSGDSDLFDPTTTIAPGQGPFGDGILFDTTLGNTTSSILRFVDIHGAQNNGIELNSVTGTFDFQALIINQATNSEMLVSGGAPDITMTSSERGETEALVDSIVVNRANGSAVIPGVIPGLGNTTDGSPGDNHDLLVLGLTGGSVNWIDVVVNDDGGDGILFGAASQVDAIIPVNTTIVNSRGNGIGIFPGVAGNFIISGTRSDFQIQQGGLTITNPTSNAIQIGLPVDPGTAALPGLVTDVNVSFVQPMTINQLSQANSAFYLANIGRGVTFQGPATTLIDYTPGGIGTASAIDFHQNFGGDLVFNNGITINNPGGAGLRITNDLDAGFVAGAPGDVRYFAPPNNGLLSINNAAQNQPLQGSAILIGSDSPAGPPSNGIMGSIYEGNVLFTTLVSINNSAGAGVLLNGNSGDVSFTGDVNVNSTITSMIGNGTSLVGIFNHSGDVLFNSLSINAQASPDIDFANDNNPTAGELANLFAALDMRNNTGDLIFNQLAIDTNSNAALATGYHGIFGLNNSRIDILEGDVDVFNNTAIEIFNTDTFVGPGPPFNMVELNMRLIDINNSLANDYGIHLANVKGQAFIEGGDIDLAGSPATVLPASDDPTDVDAGIYIDNGQVRILELANIGQIFDPARTFTLELNDEQGGVQLNDNLKGLVAIAIDNVNMEGASFLNHDREAIDLLNVVNTSITSSFFNDNFDTFIFGDGFTTEAAAIRSVMTLTLNDDNNVGGNGNPVFYDFAFGPRSPDFTDPLADGDANIVNLDGEDFAILMQNNAIDNTIGILNPDYTGPEFGFIINNNQFEFSNQTFTPMGFVRFQEAIGGNSLLNYNIVMNEMESNDDGIQGSNVDALELGAISFQHVSDNDSTIDNIVFTAADNNIILPEENSIAFHFMDEGDGNAVILVDDTIDALTEGLDPDNDFPAAINGFSTDPDIQVAEGPVFFFDLETDADIDIINLEILVGEEEDGGNVFTTVDDQRVFLFENLAGTTNINISNNFIAINDSGATLFNGQLQLINDIIVAEFNGVSGDVTLNSPQDNTVVIQSIFNEVGNNSPFINFAASALLLDPDLLFDGPNTANFSGQLQFNDIPVP